MCLIAFGLGVLDDCPLLLASNRDEFWSRPTLPLHTWTLPGGERVVSGRDLQAGGTWLGFSARGRVAMLTNVRNGESDRAPRTRGELVTQWLAGSEATPNWSSLVVGRRPGDYGGFNLVLGDVLTNEWVWLTNRASQRSLVGQPLGLTEGWFGSALERGIYGLSNAGLDPPWPKTRQIKAATLEALNHWRAGEPCDVSQDRDWRKPLLDALMDRRQADAADLPSTGIAKEREQQLSSAFVHMPEVDYGTRSSLIAHWRRCGQDGVLELEEWTHRTESSDSMPANLERWPLDRSTYRRISMSTWGMPTSS